MKELLTFEGLVAIVLCYLPIHFFNKAIISPLPKIIYRRPNKLESTLLIPVGFAYHILSFLLFVKVSSQFHITTALISLHSILKYFIGNKEWFSHVVLQVFPELAFCYENNYVALTCLAFSYLFLFIWGIPRYLGRVLGVSTLAVSPVQSWVDGRAKFKSIVQNESYPKELRLKIKKILRIDLVKFFFKSLVWPFHFIAWLLSKTKIIKDYIKFTSTDKTPDFLEEFTNENYDYVLDITIKNGKMFSGKLLDYELRENGSLEYISLSPCLRWKEKLVTETVSINLKGRKEEYKANKVERSPKLIPGDNFTIPFNSIEEINVIKTAKNNIFIIKDDNVENASKHVIEYVKKHNKHNGYIFNRFFFYLSKIQESQQDELDSLLRKEVFFIYPPSYRFFENESMVSLGIDTFFNESEKNLFIVYKD